MSKLIAVADASGNPSTGNHKYLAIVIGTEENISSIIKCLDSKQIHMSRIKNKKAQNSIISKLNFNNKDSIAFCVRINQDITIEKIKTMKRIKQKQIPAFKIIRIYNRRLMYYLRKPITEFLNMHNHTLQDVIFQCDADCRNFMKDNGLHHIDAGNAHVLSDIVAWANNKKNEPKGVILLDFADQIELDLKKIFR